MKKLNTVLSLFDGMSCGQIALNRANIKYNKYYAAEIDKYAIKVTQSNYPNTIQLGDVVNWKKWDLDWSKIDLIFAGFPCQAWSIAGKQLGDKDERGALFWTMLEIMEYVLNRNPKLKFLIENVKMKKEFEEFITYHTEKSLGKVDKYLINSAVVSAQNRKRYYWTNIKNIKELEDKNIMLKDILETGVCDRDKSYCLDANYYKGGNLKSYFEKKRRQLVFQINPSKECGNKQPYMQNRVFHLSGKSPALTASFASRLKIGDLCITSWRKLTPIECERLQTVPDNYTNYVSNTQRYKMLGNGWTIDVIVNFLKGSL